MFIYQCFYQQGGKFQTNKLPTHDNISNESKQDIAHLSQIKLKLDMHIVVPHSRATSGIKRLVSSQVS